MVHKAAKLEYYHVEEGKETQCLIPLSGYNGVSVEVRAQKECALNAITEDGETLPLEVGKIIRWKGEVTGYSAVEIVASSGFWYQCQKSSKFWEIPDPTPVVINMTVSQEDVLKVMIEERLNRWKVQQELNRPLTEEEKDELILDIAHGELEFDEAPDEFGLGYEERLQEFVNAQHASQTPAEGGEPSVPAPAAGDGVTPPDGSKSAPDSSST